MFYKVAKDTELAHMEPQLLEEIQLGSCEPLVITFSLTDQYITLLKRVFLFKNTLFNIYFLQIIICMVFQRCNARSLGDNLCYTFASVLIKEASTPSIENLLSHIMLFLLNT